MMKKTLVAMFLCVMLSGCYMIPMALVGPATSSFSTASIIQSAVTTTANQIVKKSTGKTITEHAMDSINNREVMIQSYVPEKNIDSIILPKPKPNIN